MSAELKYYELLGVKPGVSVQELKAAHRDLAKVWHPDRFGHDPRLQQKAQEKLKEINEAFDLLISGKTPRATTQTQDQGSSATYSAGFDRAGRDSYNSTVSSGKRSIGAHLIIVPLLIFGVVFFFTARSLLKRRAQSAEPSLTVSTPLQRDSALQSENLGKPTTSDSTRNKSHSDPGANPGTDTQPTSQAVPAMATVTVVIDAANGLLAKPDCPTKTKMTYPSGNEPHSYCTVVHTRTEVLADPLPTKESKIKSIAKKVASPAKWLDAERR